jgi:hypothetical protein
MTALSRRDGLLPMGTVLPTVFARKEWAGQWRLFQLVRDWPDIVGPRVAELTAPAWFRHDVLWIHVQDSAAMQHLQYLKIDLLARVNKALIDEPASDLRWALQPVLPPRPEPNAPEPAKVDPVRERAFRDLTASISDPVSREALVRLWRALADHEPG